MHLLLAGQVAEAKSGKLSHIVIDQRCQFGVRLVRLPQVLPALGKRRDNGARLVCTTICFPTAG